MFLFHFGSRDFHLCVYIFRFCHAQPTVFFWTSVAGIDIDQLRFSCHADIFSVSWFLVLDSQTPGGPGRHGRSDGLGVITRTV